MFPMNMHCESRLSRTGDQAKLTDVLSTFHVPALYVSLSVIQPLRRVVTHFTHPPTTAIFNYALLQKVF